MTQEKAIALLTKLFEKTQEGFVQWQTTASPLEYLLVFPGYSVKLVGPADYPSLALLDQGGSCIDAADSCTGSLVLPSLQSLYELVAGMEKDRAVDEVMKSLDDLPPPI